MPGLQQLKKFTETMRSLGNEEEIRSQKGEPIVSIPLPQNISEADDSDDFKFGLPSQTETPENTPFTQEDFSFYEDLPTLEDLEPAAIQDSINELDLDLANLLNSDDISEEALQQFNDYSETLMNQTQNNDVQADDDDVEELTELVSELDEVLDETSDFDIPQAETAFDANSDDFSLPEVDTNFDIPQAETAFDANSDDFSLPEVDTNFDIPQAETAFDANSDDFSLPEVDTNFDIPQAETAFDANSDDFSLPEVDTDFDIPQAETAFDANSDDFSPPEVDTNFDIPQAETAFDANSDDFSLPEVDTDFDIPQAETAFDANSDDFSLPEVDADFDIPQAETAFDANSDDFSLPELDTDFDIPLTEKNTSGTTPEDFSLELDNAINLEEEPLETSVDSEKKGDFDFALSDFDLPDFNTSDTPAENASFGSLENLDSIETTDSMLDSFGENSDDMDFAIPGFSDFDIPTASSSNPYFESPEESFTPREDLTEEEYTQFKKNLAQYPLNLRIAVEELIVNKEIRDEAVFDLIEKIIKKLSARQLSSYLLKYFDIDIDIPRDFERRTAEQYQEYKSSLQYQLKNRIIPIALAAILAVLVFTGMYRFVEHFIYKPMVAENLYKEGLALIENTMYQQADIKFNEAEYYKPKLKWYFRYAEAFKDHRQYDRARQKYTRILRNFEQNKKAGLDYARMEFEELENYPVAEKILRREVLDHHINDVDGRLMLGDVYLAWATNVDKTKFEDAYDEYLTLIEQIGTNDVLLTRLLRYYIRIDELKEVLELKNYFYPREKSLGAKDLTELSGYLLDKLYGPLAPADEYLRNYIEDVKDLLDRSYLADTTDAEAQYNLGRYFHTIGNSLSAEQWLSMAIKTFSIQEKISPKMFYKHIDTHRLLGEVYCAQEEYLKAEEILSKAISEFEQEEKYSNLPGTSVIGKTYNALANIDYFISGNLDAALLNYQSARKCGYETPVIHYHEGYIHYVKNDFDKALNSFINVYDENNSDKNGILALANTLALKKNNFAAQGYYQQLLEILNNEKSRYVIMFPQVNPEHGGIVDNFMKASNNLGVILWRLAEQTGNSGLISQALENFTVSIRAWDALTRNPATLQRLEGSNLAAQNLKYASSNIPQFELGLYTNIANILTDEKPLQQSSIK